MWSTIELPRVSGAWTMAISCAASAGRMQSIPVPRSACFDRKCGFVLALAGFSIIACALASEAAIAPIVSLVSTLDYSPFVKDRVNEAKHYRYHKAIVNFSNLVLDHV